MIEEIDFQSTDNKVSIKIDNEVQEETICKINRLPTYIDLEQSLNTALENNIEVRASIYYVKKNTTIDIEAEESNIDPNTKLNIDGTVTITIKNGDEIYYSENKRFIKGNISDSIKNTLPLGSYIMTIEYSGNKYFQPSTLSVNFDVEKRLGICKFEKERYYGDFTEIITVSGILKDMERDTPISECELQYDFNGQTHTAKTNIEGEFSLSVTIPEPDISHCTAFYEDIPYNESDFEPGDEYEEYYEEEFKDEDGNIRRYSDIESFNTLYDNSDDEASPINVAEADSNDNVISITDGSEAIIESMEDDKEPLIDTIKYYPNASYLINVYIDNDSYYLKTTQIEVVANKAPTFITVQSVNTDTASNTLTIHGSVLSTYNNTDNDVKYGIVHISLPDFTYQHTPLSIDSHNAFTTDIDLIEVYSIYNNSDVEEIVYYDTTNIINTSVTLSTEQNVVNVGEMFVVKAQVTSTSSQPVQDGALVFKLLDNDDNLLYQYAAEIDRTGLSIFNFNTSRAATYQVKAQYIGMFGYQDSQSQKLEMKVQ